MAQMRQLLLIISCRCSNKIAKSCLRLSQSMKYGSVHVVYIFPKMEHLDDENLRFDFKNYSRLRMGEFIELGQFGDEAYLARDLRLKPEFQISDDGLYVFRSVPINFESDSKTAYIVIEFDN